MGKKLIIKGADFFENALIKGQPQPTPESPIIKTYITATKLEDTIPLILANEGYDAMTTEEADKFKCEIIYTIDSEQPQERTKYVRVLRDENKGANGIFGYVYGRVTNQLRTGTRQINLSTTSSFAFLLQQTDNLTLTIQGSSVTATNGTIVRSTTIPLKSPLPSVPINTLNLFGSNDLSVDEPFNLIGKVKSIKIYYDNDIIKDFVPATMNGLPCLYERINDVCHYPSNVDNGIVVSD